MTIPAGGTVESDPVSMRVDAQQDLAISLFVSGNAQPSQHNNANVTSYVTDNNAGDATDSVDGKPFFRTGDLGRMDEDGYFFIADRLKRMINASGFKVWPAEVESLMFRHPAIQEACVIAAHDDYRGETVKAVVVLRAGQQGKVSDQDIIDWCRDNMAVYKAPRIVQFVDTLPKSGSGKVMWRALQEAELS